MSRRATTTGSWTQPTALARGRVSFDDLGRYHLLDGDYDELCTAGSALTTRVYDTALAALADRELCENCRRRKRKRLESQP